MFVQIREFVLKEKLLFSLLLILFLTAGMYRIHLAWTAPLNPGNTDPVGYHEQATRIAQGDFTQINDYFSPGYPIFLAGVYKIFGADFRIGHVTNTLLGLVDSLLLFFITLSLFKKKYLAIIALTLSLVHPELIFYSIHMYKEPLFLFLLLLIILSVIKVSSAEMHVKQKLVYLAIFAASTVYSIYLNSWIYICYILLPIYYYIINRACIKKQLVKQILLGGISVLMVSTLIFIIINALFFIPALDRPVFTLSNSGILLYYGNNPTKYSNTAFTSDYPAEMMIPLGDWIKERYELNYGELPIRLQSKYSTKYVLNFWKENPSFLLNRVTTFFFKYWLFPNKQWSQRPEIVYGHAWDKLRLFLWAEWMLALLGLMCCLTKIRLIQKTSILILLYLAVTAVYGISNYLMRYKLYIIPIEIIFAAIGIYALFGYIYKIILHWRTVTIKSKYL